MRTFLILARYASRTVYEEQLEMITGSVFSPVHAMKVFAAWIGYMRVGLRLSVYEMYLHSRKVLGFQPLTI